MFPSRRAELDTYLAIITDLALTYGGTLFYENHKSFSTKATMFIYVQNLLSALKEPEVVD